MGWFEKQIKRRNENDSRVLNDAFASIADSVLGKGVSSALNSDRFKTKTEICRILRYYGAKITELPDALNDVNEQLEYLLRPTGVMRRSVDLEKGWFKDAVGAYLGVRRDDGSVVALLPSSVHGYYFYNENGKKVRVNAKNADLFETKAICFYRPFPMKKLTLADLLGFIASSLSVNDFIALGIATLAVVLIGMLTPWLSNVIFSDVIVLDALDGKSLQIILAITFFLVCVSISSLIVKGIKQLLLNRINTKIDMSVKPATMMRIMSLKPEFFKQFSSGELSARAEYVSSLCEMFVSAVLSTGLTSLLSLIYIAQMFSFAPALFVPALLTILATVIFTTTSAFIQMKRAKRQMEISAKGDGFEYSLISGIQKIKLSGSENRAFAKWGNMFAKESELTYNPPLFVKVNGVLITAVSLIGTILIYYFSVVSGISVADYYSFNVAFGMVSGAFASLYGIILVISNIRLIMNVVKPILEAEIEESENKQVITRLSGGIELSNVSFRYDDNMPLVIDDLSVKIKAGQYVSIVGSTGSGKSTLMRLMLGFETPKKGAIYYDGRDLSMLDLKSLRRRIGVVLQDGKLFQGDIFSNITISAPWLTVEDAWKAAELAGIADDIRKMPMGMHTFISEGSGGISGGQRQRLMIARAIASKPKILLLDEATSALDNITQKKVSESLASLKCTRVVIAHRLSTIRQCDRIICLDKGKISEEGTYDELIAKNGIFAELVARQMLLDNKCKNV